MKSYWLRIVALSILGFVLGCMLAVYRHPHATAVVKPAATAAAAVTVTKTATEPMPGGAHIGGPFSLTDYNGQPVTEKSWPGKYKLVFFGYTSCPDTCPATLEKMSAVMEKIDPNGEKIIPLFITIDPARDTAAKLKLYIEASYNRHILGLTGTEAQVKAALETYKVYAAKRPGQDKDDYLDYLEDHSAYIYLMSPDDKLLQTFANDDPAEAIVTKLKDSVK